jgi:predicted transposase YdaD
MPRSVLEKLIRNFPENGPKLLLENGANVRDLLVLLREPQVPAIDFTKLTVERTHFIKPDYAHVALDLLLKAPLRLGGTGPPRTLFIYLLIEHQSKPQRFFPLRLADYLLEAYKMQKRAWDDEHDSDARFFLQPVLPIVLYTGDRHWEQIETLVDVVEAGQLFEKMIPAFTPHFFNLRDTAPERLVREGGLFGQLLWLIRERNADRAVFRQTLEGVVNRIEKMSKPEHTRWTEFLSYILALVYHARSPEERPPLHDVVDRSVQTDAHRKEWIKMSQTIAEMYLEQGREQGRVQGRVEGEQEGALKAARGMLLLQLRKRFKKVPRKVEARITATTNMQELETWVENFATAASLADVGIPLD